MSKGDNLFFGFFELAYFWVSDVLRVRPRGLAEVANLLPDNNFTGDIPYFIQES